MMQLVIRPGGQVQCVYAEAIDLNELGQPLIERASYVEPDDSGQWWADMRPIGGPVLGPFRPRSKALKAESDFLDLHWLACNLS